MKQPSSQRPVTKLRHHRGFRLRSAIWVLAAALALALVFTLYFQASLVVDLALRLWSCF